MTKLHNLTKIVGKKKKRLGRGLGSGAGAKSGRGTTRHQTARTKVPLHFEGGQNKMTKKFPLLRGKGRNKSLQAKPLTVSLEQLGRLKADTTVDIKTLIDERIVDNTAYKRGVKIVSDGELKVALQVALPASKPAQEKIEKAGGKLI